MERPLNKTLEEIRTHYPDALEKVFSLLEKEYAGEILIGSSTDETLLNAYRNDGKKQAIIDLKKMFGIYDTRT